MIKPQNLNNSEQALSAESPYLNLYIANSKRSKKQLDSEYQSLASRVAWLNQSEIYSSRNIKNSKFKAEKITTTKLNSIEEKNLIKKWQQNQKELILKQNAKNSEFKEKSYKINKFLKKQQISLKQQQFNERKENQLKNEQEIAQQKQKQLLIKKAKQEKQKIYEALLQKKLYNYNQQKIKQGKQNVIHRILEEQEHQNDKKSKIKELEKLEDSLLQKYQTTLTKEKQILQEFTQILQSKSNQELSGYYQSFSTKHQHGKESNKNFGNQNQQQGLQNSFLITEQQNGIQSSIVLPKKLSELEIKNDQ